MTKLFDGIFAAQIIRSMNIYKQIVPAIFIAMAVFFHGCDSPKSYDAITIGEMESLIKKGDMTTHMSLKDLQNTPTFMRLVPLRI